MENVLIQQFLMALCVIDRIDKGRIFSMLRLILFLWKKGSSIECVPEKEWSILFRALHAFLLQHNRPTEQEQKQFVDQAIRRGLISHSFPPDLIWRYFVSPYIPSEWLQESVDDTEEERQTVVMSASVPPADIAPETVKEPSSKTLLTPPERSSFKVPRPTQEEAAPEEVTVPLVLDGSDAEGDELDRATVGSPFSIDSTPPPKPPQESHIVTNGQDLHFKVSEQTGLLGATSMPPPQTEKVTTIPHPSTKPEVITRATIPWYLGNERSLAFAGLIIFSVLVFAGVALVKGLKSHGPLQIPTMATTAMPYATATDKPVENLVEEAVATQEPPQAERVEQAEQAEAAIAVHQPAEEPVMMAEPSETAWVTQEELEKAKRALPQIVEQIKRDLGRVSGERIRRANEELNAGKPPTDREALRIVLVDRLIRLTGKKEEDLVTRSSGDLSQEACAKLRSTTPGVVNALNCP